MTRPTTTSSEPPAPPRTPVALAAARTGDCVILAKLPFAYNSDAPPDLCRATVKVATLHRLNVSGVAYYRTGTRAGRTKPGTRRTVLVDPTPDRLAALAEADRRAAEFERQRDSDRDDRRLNRRVAADWLAAQTDPDRIESLLFGHTLDDVFEVLRQARIV